MSEAERRAQRAAKVRAEFEELMRGFESLPIDWYGQLVLHIGQDGDITPKLDVGLPKRSRRVA